MKDPLTKAEKNELFKNFRAEWEATYKKALASGMVGEEYAAPHDHRLGKACLHMAAQHFRGFSRDMDSLVEQVETI